MSTKNHTEQCLMSKISSAQGAIDHNQRRVNILERTLRLSQVHDEERENLIIKLQTIRNELSNQENKLKKLQGSNRKTFLFAIMLFVILFATYFVFWTTIKYLFFS